jgi:hypothetical protein
VTSFGTTSRTTVDGQDNVFVHHFVTIQGFVVGGRMDLFSANVITSWLKDNEAELKHLLC